MPNPSATSAWDSTELANSLDSGDVVIGVKAGGKIVRVPQSLLSQDATQAIAALQKTVSDVVSSVQQQVTNTSDGLENLKISVGNVVGDTQVTVGQNRADFDSFVTLQTDTNNSVATQISTLNANVGDNTAAISAEQTARADGDSALSNSINSTLAIANAKNKVTSGTTAPTSPATGDIWIDTGHGNALKQWDGSAWQPVDNTQIAANSAAITTEQTARANGDSALSSQITTLTSTVNSNTAAISSEATTRANADSALSSRVSTLEASGSGAHTYLQSAAPTSGMNTGDLWFDTSNGNAAHRWNGSTWAPIDNSQIATNTSAISSEQTARINGDNSLSSSITSVQATANGASASGSYRLVANASPQDGATAQFDVQISTTSNGTFSNAGMSIQILSDGTRRIKFNANQFIVTDGTTSQVPFAIVSGQVLANALKVPNANVNGLGALALKSTASATTDVTGLGSLALKNLVTYGTDTTGFGTLAGKSSVNASTDVTGLGAMAFIAKLTASNLATYMDTAIISDAYIANLSASKISAGTISTCNLRVTDGSGNYILQADLNSSGAYLWKPTLQMASASNLANPSMNSIYAQGYSVEAIYGYGNGSGSSHGVRGMNSSGAGGIVGTPYGYDFYADGSGTNYGPFTGAHDALMDPSEDPEIGEIVVDVECMVRGGVSNTLFRITRSAQPRQKGVVGVVAVKSGILSQHMTPAVFQKIITPPPDPGPNPQPGDIKPPTVELTPEAQQAWDSLKDSYNLVLMNALGEGQIQVCGEGGDIERGDLIVSSSTMGKGMRQEDDLVRSYTVARARESVTFSSPGEVKMIACIYLCG